MSEEEHGETDRKISKVIIIGSVLVTVLTLIGLHIAFGPRWYQGYAPEQPIPYSHQLHAGQYKLPCVYCHGSAEKADFSAVPELQLCMNCHHAVKTDSPWIQKMTKAYKEGRAIKWVKVHVLPDFVYFNHRPHIAAGVECQTCHGPIETMTKVYQWAPLSMDWCVNCHRNNNYVQPYRANLLNKEAEIQGYANPDWIAWIGGHQQLQNADVSCSTCHH